MRNMSAMLMAWHLELLLAAASGIALPRLPANFGIFTHCAWSAGVCTVLRCLRPGEVQYTLY